MGFGLSVDFSFLSALVVDGWLAVIVGCRLGEIASVPRDEGDCTDTEWHVLVRTPGTELVSRE